MINRACYGRLRVALQIGMIIIGVATIGGHILNHVEHGGAENASLFQHYANDHMIKLFASLLVFVSILGLAAERQVIKSAQNLNHLLNQLPLPVFIKNRKNQYVYGNKAFHDLSGHICDDILGKTLTELAPPEQAQRLHDAEAQLLTKGGVIEAKELVITRSKTRRHVVTRKSVLEDTDGERLIIGSLLDVTELRNIEDRLMTAKEAGGIGVWDWDLTNNSLVWDDTMFEIYDVDKGAHDGTYETWRRTLLPIDLNRSERLIQAAIADPTCVKIEGHFRITRCNSEMRYIKLNGTIQRDESGRAYRMIGVNYDVTEIKRLELELRESQRHLETRVAQQTEALKIAKDRAEAANQAKSDFLANMSHELRTPLNSIIGLTQLMLDDKISIEHREMLGNIDLSSQNLLEIVNDILDLSKIESGNLSLESISFSPRGLLKRTCAILQPMATARGLPLVLNMSIPDNTAIQGDPTRIARILTNLIGNAIKYTEVGKIEIIATLDTTLSHRYIWHLEVHDSGIGIPEDKLDLIFEKFAQADSSTTRKYGGSGLGLTITKQLVEMMGGRISVRSTVGIGSCFTVWIPCAPASAEYVPEVEVSEETQASLFHKPAHEARILVAEDHKLNQIYVRRLLAKLGFEHFDVVDDGDQALKAWQAGNYDLILMDCHMPNLGGYDATAQIRKAERGTGGRIPIIAMTANAMVGERERCLASGMDDYVSKPVTHRQLQRVLSQWIEFSEQPVQPDTPTSLSTPSELLDPQVLAGIADGDATAELELAQVFVSETDRHVRDLLSLAQTGQVQAWREKAHLMKGSAANVGANMLRDLCAQAQDMTQASVPDRFAKSLEIEQNYRALRQRLREIYKIKLEDGEADEGRSVA
jgi:PAS domain S-box-containing protein